ncbi:MAG: hypothetical protein ABH846_01240 [Patescibacteria group bacterium]
MNKQSKNRALKTVKKSKFEIGLISVMAVLLVMFAVPTGEALADENVQFENLDEGIALRAQVIQNAFTPFGELPEAELAPPLYSREMTITAYNSVAAQTDSTPCIGAAGTNVCATYQSGTNVCAANFVPKGTWLEVEGLGRCRVDDRMNARYYYRVDWFMDKNVSAARQFGVQTRTVSVYPS